MTNPNLTEIVCILDRSGSMIRRTPEVIGGYNHFLSEQRLLDGEARVTLVLFDNKYEMVYDAVPIQEVEFLNEEVYSARGATALHDAIGRTIDLVGMRLAMEPEEKRPGKVIVLIMTDGYENSSSDYSAAKIKEMVEHQQAKYSWEFVFIGAGIDAVTAGGNLGIGAGSTLSVSGDAKGVASSYEVMTRSVTSYRTTGDVGDLSVDEGSTDE